MHPAIKMIIGILIAIAGLYWYLADYIGYNFATTWIGMSAIIAMKQVFIGVFGAFLILIGIIIAWIELEDIKWEMREKREVQTKAKK